MNEKKFIGEEMLRINTAQIKPSTVTQLADNIFVFQYFGASNATLLIGEKACIMVDAFESDGYALAAKKEIEKITDKPLSTLIYTHSHVDHTGGAAVFADTVQTVIGHSSCIPVIGRQEKIAHMAQRRASRQFGTTLTIEESISMGLNPAVKPNGSPKPLPVSQWVDGDVVDLTLEGIHVQLIAAPGETDEGQAIWIPDQKVFCGGDNYYASWPNLCALRGSTYRDVDRWVASLGKYLEYPVEHFVPGHGEILEGNGYFREVVGNYRDAIDWVLDQTLQGIDEGKTPDELVASVKLPDKWAKLPYLQEYYGTVAWSVRGIFNGYVGWFDGNPSHIGTLVQKKRAEKLLVLAGGEERVAEAVHQALREEDMQWAMELCDMLIDAGFREKEAKEWKAQACVYLGRMQTSANGRHYYLTCAKELSE